MASKLAKSSLAGAPMKKNARKLSSILVSTTEAKMRALARRMGSRGRRLEEGKISARNSTMAMDSVRTVASVEGLSGGCSGPPYVIAGIWVKVNIRLRQPGDERKIWIQTLPVGLTFRLYHWGFSRRSIVTKV